MWKYQIGPNDTDALQNFANWFSYYGNRNRAMIAGLTRSMMDVNNMRVGYFTINTPSGNTAYSNVTMRDMADTTQKTALYTDMLALNASGGTPNLYAVDFIGKQFQRKLASDPVRRSNCNANAMAACCSPMATATAERRAHLRPPMPRSLAYLSNPTQPTAWRRSPASTTPPISIRISRRARSRFRRTAQSWTPAQRVETTGLPDQPAYEFLRHHPGCAWRSVQPGREFRRRILTPTPTSMGSGRVTPPIPAARWKISARHRQYARQVHQCAYSGGHHQRDARNPGPGGRRGDAIRSVGLTGGARGQWIADDHARLPGGQQRHRLVQHSDRGNGHQRQPDRRGHIQLDVGSGEQAFLWRAQHPLCQDCGVRHHSDAKTISMPPM